LVSFKGRMDSVAPQPQSTDARRRLDAYERGRNGSKSINIRKYIKT